MEMEKFKTIAQSRPKPATEIVSRFDLQGLSPKVVCVLITRIGLIKLKSIRAISVIRGLPSTLDLPKRRDLKIGRRSAMERG